MDAGGAGVRIAHARDLDGIKDNLQQASVQATGVHDGLCALDDPQGGGPTSPLPRCWMWACRSSRCTSRPLCSCWHSIWCKGSCKVGGADSQSSREENS